MNDVLEFFYKKKDMTKNRIFNIWRRIKKKLPRNFIIW
jgi:hypothetical protein